MPRRNRVDPWGDLHAVAARGLLTGNRGCLVDEQHRVVRHHRSTTLWIACLLEPQWPRSLEGRRHPLDEPGVWTPLFFLDEAVALAAGHRPCAFCRRADYVSYRNAVAAGGRPPLAAELDRRLASERLRGRGLDRAADRPLRPAPIAALPAGTVIVGADGKARLLGASTLQRFAFDGWGAPEPRPDTGTADVLTPPTSVAALAGGFPPLLHPSAES